MSASKTMPSAGVEGAGAGVPAVAAAGVAGAAGVPAGARVSVERRRARATISTDEVARGAPDEVLARPAGEVFDAVPWSGASPDPDALDAVTFLAWL